MTKFSLRLKSFSNSTPTSPSTSPVDDATGGGDSPYQTKKRSKPQRTPNKYLTNLRENRFFTLRKRRSREREGEQDLQVDRIPTPKSLPGRGKSPFSGTATATLPKTPQIASLFSSQAVRSESHRHHHRQYAVSLSSFPQIRNVMMGHSASLDPESPSVSRLRRLNSQKQRVTSAPIDLGAMGHILNDEDSVAVAAAGVDNSSGSVVLLEEGTIVSISQSIMPIPSLILQAPTSGSGGELNQSTDFSDPAGADDPSTDLPPPVIIHEKPFSSTGKQTTATGFHRSLLILQEAAKRLQAEGEYTQWSLFWFLILPTIILASMATFTFFPTDTISDVRLIFGMNNSISIPCIVGVSVAASLRWVLWIAASLFYSFCEMDLEAFFVERKDGIVDQDGKRVAQADIVSGIFG